MRNQHRLIALILCAAGAPAATYFVGPSGNNSPTGGTTEATAWKTLNYAAGRVNPGDSVTVLDGTYNETFRPWRNGTSSAWISWSAKNWGKALIRAADAATGAIHAYATQFNNAAGTLGYPAGICYQTFNGFDCVGNGAQDGIGIRIEWAHHVTVSNCTAHNSGLSGIALNSCDYTTATSNYCYSNSSTSDYGGYGIHASFRSSDGTTGIRNYIIRNRCAWNYQNNLKTGDGGGIAMDGDAYDPGCVIENNVCIANGSRGIVLIGAKNVQVRFNTCFGNLTHPNIPSNYGDIEMIQPNWFTDPGQNVPNTNCLIYANIIYARAGRRALSINGSTTNSSWWQNLRFHDAAADYAGDATGWNDLTSNPKLTNTNTNSFDHHLQSSSPAINVLGQTGMSASVDYDGQARPRGASYDMGADEY